tara:strand:+ start:242 stop:634 length:393 start_codon:yes stop_codon:yes gene_type:complete
MTDNYTENKDNAGSDKYTKGDKYTEDDAVNNTSKIQDYYYKFQNLSELKQRQILAFTAILINWVLLSWFPFNALFIYILARGITINSDSDKNRVRRVSAAMLKEVKFIYVLLKTTYLKYTKPRPKLIHTE